MKPSFRAALLAAVALVSLSSWAQSPFKGLTWESTNWYFTTQPSTPAGDGNTPYNLRHRPPFGGEMSGVATLFLGGDPNTGFGTGCSGSLLSTGRHILTAAHCVTDANGKPSIDLKNTINVANFATNPTGAFTGTLSQDVEIIGIKVHPGWNGDALFNGNDLAILYLGEQAPTAAKRYDIYTGKSDMGVVGTKVGWGNVGLGSTGVVQSPFGFLQGQNVWELNASVFWAGITSANPGIALYDFDNGKTENDSFGYYFDLNNLGLGDMEVSATFGDSGGPTFIDGKVAGIASFGLTFFDNDKGECLPGNPDVVCGLNSSFGEFGGDTRVGFYADWIAASIPEPSTYALMALGLLAVGARARRAE